MAVKSFSEFQKQAGVKAPQPASSLKEDKKEEEKAKGFSEFLQGQNLYEAEAKKTEEPKQETVKSFSDYLQQGTYVTTKDGTDKKVSNVDTEGIFQNEYEAAMKRNAVLNVGTGAVNQYAGSMANAGGMVLDNYTAALQKGREWAASAGLMDQETTERLQRENENRELNANALRDFADERTMKGQAQVSAAHSQADSIENKMLSKAAGIAIDVGVSGIQMAMDGALSGLTGANSLAIMFARCYGGGAQEARMEGADLAHQNAYGIATAGVEVLTEMMFDGVAKIYGAGAADDITKQIVTKLASTDNGRNALRNLIGMAGEGVEEAVSDLAAPFTELLKGTKSWDEIDKWDISEIGYDFLVGALSAGITSGVATITGQYKAENAAMAQEDVQKACADYWSSLAKKAENGAEIRENAVKKLDQATQDQAMKMALRGQLNCTEQELQQTMDNLGIEEPAILLELQRQGGFDNLKSLEIAAGALKSAIEKNKAPDVGANVAELFNNESEENANGKQSIDIGREDGNDDLRAGEPAGQEGGEFSGAGEAGQREVGQSYGQNEEGALREVSYADSADQSKAWEIKNASTENVVAQNADALEGRSREAADMVTRMGLEPVPYRGEMTVNGTRVNGYFIDGKVYFQTDAANTADKIVKHELFHAARETDGSIVENAKEIIREKLGEEDFKHVTDRYYEAYSQIYDFADMTEEQIMALVYEEMGADAYAGMNMFDGKRADAVQGVNESMADVQSRENAAATKNTNGPNGRASFAGEYSNTADKIKLSNAQEMENSGASAEEIRRETGWFRGMDGMWRYEINDRNASASARGDKQFSSEHPDYADYMMLQDKIMTGEPTQEEWTKAMELSNKFSESVTLLAYNVRQGKATLGDIMQHDELYKAYPAVAKTKVVFAEMNGVNGNYNPVYNVITLNSKLMQNREKLTSTLLHEVQHWIQDEEGFSGGTNQQAMARRDAATGEYTKQYKDNKKALLDSMTEEQKELYREYQSAEQNWNDAIMSGDDERTERAEAEYDRLYKEIWGQQWFQELQGLNAALVEDRFGNEYASPIALYSNAAGELEARDVQKRMNMTDEQRSETEPRKANKLTVFAEGKNERNLIDPDFEKNFDSWVKRGRNDRESIRIGMTSIPLQEVGVDSRNIFWKTSKINKIQREHKEMGDGVLRQIPKLLEEPILIMKSVTQVNRVTMYGEVYADNGIPVMAALELLPTSRNHFELEKIEVASAYTKLEINGENTIDKTQGLINESKILYIEPNEKKTNSWLSRNQLQLPLGIDHYGLIEKISLVHKDVNGNFSAEPKKIGKSDIENQLELWKKKNGMASVEVLEEERKQKQLEIIQNNPYGGSEFDDKTWIRRVSDILTYEEAIDEYGGPADVTPDFKKADVEKALKTGKITVYSSHNIRTATFVTPSRMEAQSYAGSGKLFSKTVNLADVAWIDEIQGQYAPVDGGRASAEVTEGAKIGPVQELDQETNEYFKRNTPAAIQWDNEHEVTPKTGEACEITGYRKDGEKPEFVEKIETAMDGAVLYDRGVAFYYMGFNTPSSVEQRTIEMENPFVMTSEEDMKQLAKMMGASLSDFVHSKNVFNENYIKEHLRDALKENGYDGLVTGRLNKNGLAEYFPLDRIILFDVQEQSEPKTNVTETETVETQTDATETEPETVEEQTDVAEEVKEPETDIFGAEIGTAEPVEAAEDTNVLTNEADMNVGGKEEEQKTGLFGEEITEESESTSVNTDPAVHTEVEQNVIEEFQNAVDSNLVNFFTEAVNNPGGKERFNFKKVSERAAEDIKKITGVESLGNETVMEARMAEHINKEHGGNGKTDHSMKDVNDIGRIQYVLDNYDSAEDGGRSTAYTTNKKNGKTGQARTVVFKKAVNGTFYVVEAVPDTKAKTVFIVTAYMQKKKTGNSQTADAKAPAYTSETGSVSEPVNKNVLQDTETVNTGLFGEEITQETEPVTQEATQEVGLFGEHLEEETVAETAETVVETAEAAAETAETAAEEPETEAQKKAAEEREADDTEVTKTAEELTKPAVNEDAEKYAEDPAGYLKTVDTGDREAVRRAVENVDLEKTPIFEMGELEVKVLLNGENNRVIVKDALYDKVVLHERLQNVNGDLTDAIVKASKAANAADASMSEKAARVNETLDDGGNVDELLGSDEYTEYRERTAKRLSEAEEALNGFYDTGAQPIVQDVKAKTEERTNARKEAEKTTMKEKLQDTWSAFKRIMVNQGDSIHQIAQKLDNRSIDGYYFYAMAGKTRAADWVTNKRSNNLGETTGKSLNEIFDPIRAKGDEYYNAFQSYMYHELNVERMSRSTEKELQDNQLRLQAILAQMPELATMADGHIRNLAEMPIEQGFLAKDYIEAKAEQRRLEKHGNKPVFGWDTSAEYSRNMADALLRENPEFKELAKGVYEYIDDLTQYQVDTGLISQEQANQLKNAYEHYVPVFYDRQTTQRGVAAGNVNVSSGVKAAYGGKEQILPLHVSLARKTQTVMQNAGINQLGNELLRLRDENKSVMEQYILDAQEAEDGWTPDTVDEDGVWQPNAENEITILDNGKRYTLTLDKGMSSAFQSFRPTDSDLKALNLMKAGNDVFKKLCTAWNPYFLVTNAVKDAQDAVFYSSDGARWSANMPKAYEQIKSSGKYWEMYKAMGGVYGSYFDWMTGETEKTGGMIGKLESLNMAIEQAPRLSEFMTILQNAEADHGTITMQDQMEAFLGAQEITTNFGRSGSLGRIINRYLVPFWNPGVQGASKVARSIMETKGAKQWAALIGKAVLLGILPEVINELVYFDDDEWDEISDRNKMNYYLFKGKDGIWYKLPKGRVLAALSSVAVAGMEKLRGDEVDFGEIAEGAIDNVAPNNPLQTNLFSAAISADLFDKDSTGKTWYGSNIESQRLQNYAVSERYDESTDAISKWLGKTLDLSPKKINYIIDQYSGVIGDVLLPLLTPKAERGLFDIAGKQVGVVGASKFTLDTVTSNTISGEYYDLSDELKYDKNSDDLGAAAAYAYMNKRGDEISDIYKKIRDIENDTELTDAEKTTLTRELRKTLNLTMEDIMEKTGKYRETADEYLKGHEELNYNDTETVKAWMDGYNDEQSAEDYFITEEQAASKMRETVKRETNRELFGSEYALEAYNSDVYEKAKKLNEDSGISYDLYYDYYFATTGLHGDKGADGKTISGSKKEKVVAAIDELDATPEEKDALYIAAGYTKGTLKSTPWNGGSGKYSSGSGGGSGKAKTTKMKGLSSISSKKTGTTKSGSSSSGSSTKIAAPSIAGAYDTDTAYEKLKDILDEYGGDPMAALLATIGGGKRGTSELDWKL